MQWFWLEYISVVESMFSFQGSIVSIDVTPKEKQYIVLESLSSNTFFFRCFITSYSFCVSDIDPLLIFWQVIKCISWIGGDSVFVMNKQKVITVKESGRSLSWVLSMGSKNRNWVSDQRLQSGNLIIREYSSSGNLILFDSTQCSATAAQK